MSTFNVPSVDYSSRDFAGLRDDLISMIPFFTPEWTDRNPDDLGIVLLELFAYMGDGVHFYVDRRAQNAYLPSAFTRPAVVRLLQLIGFDVPTKTAALADELFTITSDPLDGDLTLPINTVVETVGGTDVAPLPFETLVSTIFRFELLTANISGSTSVYVISTLNFSVGDGINIRDDASVSGEAGTIDEIVSLTEIKLVAPVTGSYTTAQNARISNISKTVSVQQGVSDEELGWDVSSGLPWETREIEFDNVLRDSIHVYVEEGAVWIEWEIIESLVDALPTSNVCELELSDDSRYVVRFGDGSTGRIPPLNAPIKAEFRVGGGLEGNVGATTITTLVSTITFSGNVVSFDVTNPESSSGGADEMALSDAKLLGPASLRALNRAVTLEDYATLAYKVAGVGEAKAVLVPPTYLREIEVYITPTGAYTPTAALVTEVYDYLDERNMAADVLTVLPPKHVPEIDVAGTVYVLDEHAQLEVAARVEAAIDEFFSPGSDEAKFGQDVHFSDFMALLDNIYGVDYVDIDKMKLNELTVLDEVTWSGDATIDSISNSTLPAPFSMVEEDWYIEFISTSNYKIVGASSGTFTGGNNGVLFQPANCPIQTLVSWTVGTMAVGDKATFRTSTYRGNVTIYDYEIRKRGNIALVFSGGA